MADTEVIIANPTTGGRKGVKLARFDLIPSRPLELLAEHYGKGSFKHGDRNWERGYNWGYSFGALMRHAWAFWRGEDYDNHESDCPKDCVKHTESHHMVAVAWHAFALLEFSRTCPQLDDRSKP